MNAWRDLPPTRAQRRVLARIAAETGKPVGPVTRGQAADLICERFTADASAHAASRRAQAIRKRAGGAR
jgi:hypothetical protein